MVNMLNFCSKEMKTKIIRRGTNRYIAPEFGYNFYATLSCDIYSFGKTLERVLMSVGTVEFIPPGLLEKLRRLEYKATERFPHNRPSLDEIIAVLDPAIVELT